MTPENALMLELGTAIWTQLKEASERFGFDYDGANFDEAYAASQVKATQAAIAQIQQEAQTTDVPQIKAFAEETLPKLQNHLQMARALQASR